MEHFCVSLVFIKSILLSWEQWKLEQTEVQQNGENGIKMKNWRHKRWVMRDSEEIR